MINIIQKHATRDQVKNLDPLIRREKVTSQMKASIKRGYAVYPNKAAMSRIHSTTTGTIGSIVNVNKKSNIFKSKKNITINYVDPPSPEYRARKMCIEQGIDIEKYPQVYEDMVLMNSVGNFTELSIVWGIKAINYLIGQGI